MTNKDTKSASSLFCFPTQFVWWVQLENHLEIKNKYSSIIDDDYKLNYEIYNQKNKWDCDVTSSFFADVPVSTIFDNYFFDNVIWNTLDQMIEELSNSIINLPIPKESIVKNIWYNKYQSGQWQEIHDHASKNFSRSFSGIYLLDIKEENNTVFFDKQIINCFQQDVSSFNTNMIPEGSVIWFPSELLHYVKPCLSDRTTVSFNIFSKYGDVSNNK